MTDALHGLDPASRALLDLSLRRGMEPSDLAAMLGIGSDQVIALREGALESLAGVAGGDLDRTRTLLAELPAESWVPPRPWSGAIRRGTPLRARRSRRRRPPARAARRRRSAPRHARVVHAPPALAPVRARRRSGGPALAALLVVAGIAALVVGLTRGGTAHPRALPSLPVRASPSARFTSMAAGAGGTAQLGGDRLTVSVFPPQSGEYTLWLFNSVVDSRPLVTFDGSLHRTLTLPSDYGRFRYLDVTHAGAYPSGIDELRLPTESLSAQR